MNFENGRKILTLLTFGCPTHNYRLIGAVASARLHGARSLPFWSLHLIVCVCLFMIDSEILQKRIQNAKRPILFATNLISTVVETYW